MQLLSMSVEVATLGFIGKLDETEILASTGLAITFWNILLFSISNGTLKALESLAIQDRFNARKVFKTARMVCFIVFILMAIVLCFSKQILMSVMNQSDKIAEDASIMILAALPGLWGYS